MAYTQRIAWETMRSIDAAALTGGYDALGTPLTEPSFILKLVNDSDTSVTVSIDGSNDIDILPANSFVLYDETKGKIPDVQFIPENTQFYVSGVAGTGTIYLVSQYLKKLTGRL